MGEEQFVSKVVGEMNKEQTSEEIASRRHFSKSAGVDEIYNAVCEFYGVSALIDPEHREMFVCLAKESSNALNREIAQKIGRISDSAIAHQYRRVKKKMAADDVQLERWQQEKVEVMSRFKG